MGRLRLYADEFKIRRELEGADAALTRAGFAPLRGLPLRADEDVAPTRRYLASVRALISAIGIEEAAGASVALKRTLAPEPAAPPAEPTDAADGGERRRTRDRSLADLLPWLSRHRR